MEVVKEIVNRASIDSLICKVMKQMYDAEELFEFSLMRGANKVTEAEELAQALMMMKKRLIIAPDEEVKTCPTYDEDSWTEERSRGRGRVEDKRSVRDQEKKNFDISSKPWVPSKKLFLKVAEIACETESS